MLRIEAWRYGCAEDRGDVAGAEVNVGYVSGAMAADVDGAAGGVCVGTDDAGLTHSPVHRG